MTPWRQRNWFITGATSGIGRELTLAVAQAGGRVVAVGRSQAALERLGSASGRIHPLQLDVTDVQATSAVIRQAQTVLGGIDVLANSAGYGFFGGIEEASDAEIRDQFETNVFGLMNVTRQVLPLMRARPSGFVVNLSSMAGLMGTVAAAYYSASKFAVEGFSEALREEVEPFGIGVMLVEPGAIRTDFMGRSTRWAQHAVAAYQNVAARRSVLESFNGLQPGDPVRCAQAILQAMESEHAPCRLVLGRSAAAASERIHARRLEEAVKWRALAEAADFPQERSAR